MLYVVDCSVALKWFLPERLSDKAKTLLRHYRAGSMSLVAPELLYAEFGYSLRKRHPEELHIDDVRGIWKDFIALDLETEPIRPLADAAMNLAVDRMGGYYDAVYVALALKRDCQVVTDDGRMRNAFAALDCIVLLESFTP